MTCGLALGGLPPVPLPRPRPTIYYPKKNIIEVDCTKTDRIKVKPNHRTLSAGWCIFFDSASVPCHVFTNRGLVLVHRRVAHALVALAFQVHPPPLDLESLAPALGDELPLPLQARHLAKPLLHSVSVSTG